MPFAADIYYHLYQEGEVEKLPVVLVHGAGGTHLYWPSQIRRMTGFCVYALDLPGHGKSGGSGLQSISGYGRCMIDWLGAIGLEQAVFVGHSMGSAVPCGWL
jgi:pimeloyl-ACP methyl ester carboxylesterase